MSNRGLNRRDLLSQAMSEETWYNKTGKHKQQRDMQEFMLRTPTQVSTPREKRVEEIEETARNKQKAREKMSERMRRTDDGLGHSDFAPISADGLRVEYRRS